MVRSYIVDQRSVCCGYQSANTRDALNSQQKIESKSAVEKDNLNPDCPGGVVTSSNSMPF